MTLSVESTVQGVRSAVAAARRDGRSVGLVPTMGALHEGHGSLFDRAQDENDLVVASIFVNPTQFDDPEDFARYPRSVDRDFEFLAECGVEIVFAPSVEVMYPTGDLTVGVDPGEIAGVLEGKSRPGHFRGVATVVTKLLSIVEADRAYFGEKDYQQLVVIRRVVEALSIRTTIVACATVRDNEGLALSSRNERLSEEERRAAPILYAALRMGAFVIDHDEHSVAAIEEAMKTVVAAEPLAQLDYAKVRDARTFEAVEELSSPVQLLIAAKFGNVRLIDNLGPLHGEHAGHGDHGDHGGHEDHAGHGHSEHGEH